MFRFMLLAGFVFAAGSISNGNAQPVDTAMILKEDFKKLVDTLKAMDNDMQLFNLDRIHPRLEQVYRLYDGMTALATDVGKLKARTETLHRLFDAGELEVSKREAQELIRYAEKLKVQLGRAE